MLDDALARCRERVAGLASDVLSRTRRRRPHGPARRRLGGDRGGARGGSSGGQPGVRVRSRVRDVLHAQRRDARDRGAVAAALLRRSVPAVELPQLARPLLSFHDRVRWLEDRERIVARIACPFADPAGRVAIHAARPLACRSIAPWIRRVPPRARRARGRRGRNRADGLAPEGPPRHRTGGARGGARGARARRALPRRVGDDGRVPRRSGSGRRVPRRGARADRLTPPTRSPRRGDHRPRCDALTLLLRTGSAACRRGARSSAASPPSCAAVAASVPAATAAARGAPASHPSSSFVLTGMFVSSWAQLYGLAPLCAQTSDRARAPVRTIARAHSPFRAS